MPTKQRKPINSSSRFQTHLTFEELTRQSPEKSLTKGKHSSGGRNNSGPLTSWGGGGGHQKRYPGICFKGEQDGLRVGGEVVAGDNVEVNVGNALPLKRIPLGTVIHNIELKIGKGGQMVRSAGGAAQLMAR